MILYSITIALAAIRPASPQGPGRHLHVILRLRVAAVKIFLAFALAVR